MFFRLNIFLPHKLRIALACYLICFCQMILQGQYDNVWVFGGRAGIDFNSTPPVSMATSIGTMEGSASICNSEGKLLFYTDGTNVWDSDHQLMPGGTNLPGLGVNITSSTTQGALIVPIPGRGTEYYVFSLGAFESGMVGRLYYCIVDMALNNGKGDVVPGTKSKLLASDLTEQMTAVSGKGCNTWLVVASRLHPQVRAYSIAFGGLDTVPVISPKVTGAGSWGGVLGTADASPDRKRIAFAQGNLVIYDFDAATGKLAQPITLTGGEPNLYGVAFSPDNSKLYTTANGFAVYQFDLSLSDTQQIKASKMELKSEQVYAIKRAPDGKIYIAVPESALSVIHKPNLAGSACDYQSKAFSLATGQCQLGLPNTAAIVLNKKNHSAKSDTVICTDSVILRANNLDAMNYRWQDGSVGRTFKADTSGTYWVTYQNYTTECEDYTDTFYLVLQKNKRVYRTTVLDALCAADTFLLRPEIAYAEGYTWEDHARDSEKVVRAPGIYWVNYSVDSICGIYADTFDVRYPESNYDLSFAVDTLLCVHDTLEFNNTAHAHFNRFQWRYGDGKGDTVRSPRHSYSEAGRYQVKLFAWIDGKCADSATKFITVDSIFQVVFQKDKEAVCQGETIHFYPHVNMQMTALYWNYGTGNQLVDTGKLPTQHAFEQYGTFPVTLTALNRVCSNTHFTDTVRVKALPVVDLGPESRLCWKGQPVLLQNRAIVSKAKYHYLWNTGATSPGILATAPGLYWLRITEDIMGCSGSETIIIDRDCYIDIPNAFTPNGDGHNDYFFPSVLLRKSVEVFRMQVLDRWGRLVFETAASDGRGWDGRNGGREAPAGVYVYHIEVQVNGRIEQYTGNISLLR